MTQDSNNRSSPRWRDVGAKQDPIRLGWIGVLLAVAALIVAGIAATLASTPTPLELDGLTGTPDVDARIIQTQISQRSEDRVFELSVWSLGSVVTAATLLVAFNFFQNRTASERERQALDRTIDDAVGDRFSDQQRTVRESMSRIETSLSSEIDRIDRKVDHNRQLQTVDWNGHEEALTQHSRSLRGNLDISKTQIFDLERRLILEGKLSGSAADVSAKRVMSSQSGITIGGVPIQLQLSLDHLRADLQSGHKLEATLIYRMAEAVNPVPDQIKPLWEEIYELIDQQRTRDSN